MFRFLSEAIIPQTPTERFIYKVTQLIFDKGDLTILIARNAHLNRVKWNGADSSVFEWTTALPPSYFSTHMKNVSILGDLEIYFLTRSNGFQQESLFLKVRTA